MNPYTLTLLLFGMLAGAGLATLITTPSHITYDRLLIASLGGIFGLIATIFVLGSWHFGTRLLGGV